MTVAKWERRCFALAAADLVGSLPRWAVDSLLASSSDRRGYRLADLVAIAVGRLGLHRLLLFLK